MKKLLSKLNFNVILEKAGTIELKKVQRCLLIFLVIFVWLLAISLFFIKTSLEKIEAAPIITARPTAIENEIRKMVAGYPIEKMSGYIAKQDKRTAAFMIAIAKKESNWGKRVPVLNEADCFNYWGYREKRERMGSGGHTCFDSPRDAVSTVANRIDELVVEYNLDTPSKMIVWKCGYGCKGHDKESVRKWIADVDFYYEKLIN